MTHSRRHLLRAWPAAPFSLGGSAPVGGHQPELVPWIKGCPAPCLSFPPLPKEPLVAGLLSSGL